jgi:hypothetical protein
MFFTDLFEADFSSNPTGQRGGRFSASQMRAMFAVGQKWHVMRDEQDMVIHGNTGPTKLAGKNNDQVRTVQALKSREIAWTKPEGGLCYTTWPKSSEIIDMKPGFVKFAYSDMQNSPTITLTIQDYSQQ